MRIYERVSIIMYLCIATVRILFRDEQKHVPQSVWKTLFDRLANRFEFPICRTTTLDNNDIQIMIEVESDSDSAAPFTHCYLFDKQRNMSNVSTYGTNMWFSSTKNSISVSSTYYKQPAQNTFRLLFSYCENDIKWIIQFSTFIKSCFFVSF